MSIQKKRAQLIMSAVFVSMFAAIFLFTPVHPARAFLLRPFGGYLTDVDYETCTCGFVIFTLYDKTTKSTYRVIGPWPGLDQLFGIIISNLFGISIPRIYYLDYAVWPGSDANVVGSFFPYPSATCLAFSNTGCSTAGSGDGYLFQMGTSISSDG
jgi:hypothetical protein